MEESVDPHAAASTTTEPVIVAAENQLLLRADQTSIPTSQSTTHSDTQNKGESQLQQLPDSLDLTQQQQQHRESTTTTAAAIAIASTVLDEERIQTTLDMSINPADVLSGRDKQSFNHVGNKYFRELVAASLSEYMEKQTRFEKSFVVQNVVDAIHGRGGRFLKKDSRLGKFVELTMTQSREKVGHAIRDAATLYISKQRPQPRPKKNDDVPYNIPTGIQQQKNDDMQYDIPPVTTSAAASASRPSAKRQRPRQQPQQQQQRPQQQHRLRDSLGSSSVFSMGGDAFDVSSPVSQQRYDPNLLYGSPIQFQQPNIRQQGGYYDQRLLLSPSVVAPTNRYRFDTNLGDVGGAQLRSAPQSQSEYQMDHQMYQQRRQLLQQQQQQLYHQQQQQQQLGSGDDPNTFIQPYSSYPSQQMMYRLVPVPPMPILPAPLPIQRQEREPLGSDMDTVSPQPLQRQQRFMSLPPYNMPLSPYSIAVQQQVTNMPPFNVVGDGNSMSRLDSYTQMLFQQQQERFYRDFPVRLQQQQQQRQQARNDDNDVFLEAIDSVLGPIDPNNNNNNNHFEDGSQPTIDLAPFAFLQSSLELPIPLDPSESPDELEEQKRAASLPSPQNTDRSQGDR